MPTLYITRENGALSQKGDALLWRPEHGAPCETLPSSQISDVIVLGQGNITTQALHLLMDAQIPVHYLTSNGRYKGSLITGHERGFAIRRLHYQYVSDPELCLKIAKSIIAGKLLNQRNTLLRYYYRRCKPHKLLAEACDELKSLIRSLFICKSIEQVRGVEGTAARCYFRAFATIIQPPWRFAERNRRPPKDPVNAMLSFGYTLLLSRVVSAILIAGLDPCVGFVHPEYRGRPALALDLMEEFRSPVVDRLVINICGHQSIVPGDFQVQPDKGVAMSKEAGRRFLRSYAERLRTAVTSQNTGYQTSIEKHINIQSALFLRSLRTATDYLPFVMNR